MPDPAPEGRPSGPADPPRRALQPRALAEEWDARLWEERLALVREATRRARPLYAGGEPLLGRLHEPGIWMLVGLPSSGKTTFAHALRDLGRRLVGIDEVRKEEGFGFGTEEWQEEAYRRAYRRIEAALARGGVVFESTGLWEPARETCRRLAREARVPVRALVVAEDPAVCRARELERRPEAPFLVRVLDVYARVLEELPREGYASLHWLTPAERARLLRSAG